MNHLANQHLRVTIADTGSLLAVENHRAAEAYHFAADTFAVESDLGRFSNEMTPASGVTHTPDALLFHFAFAQVSLDLIYRLDAANGFFRRHLKLTNQTPLRLYKVTLGNTVFADAQETLTISTTFRLNPALVERLEQAKPQNYAEMGATIARWQVSSETSYCFGKEVVIGRRRSRL